MTIERILVTGSSGMIGTALVKRLRNDGYTVHCTDVSSNQWSEKINDQMIPVDLTNPDEVSKLPCDIDLIVHLAAYARVYPTVEEPSRMMDNLEMTYNILEHARRSGVPNFLFASSREVYGDGDQTVFTESDTKIGEAKSPYTASKAGGEAMVNAYRECYDISTCVTRFSNIYGRFDDNDRVIPLFIALSSRGQPLTVFGSEKILDFTYIDDCVNGVLRTIEKFETASGTTLNISSGRGTSLVEVAREINDRTPSDSMVQVETPRHGEVCQYVGDISKAEKIIGYRPQYSLSEGLEQTVDWYLNRTSLLDRIIEHSRT